MGVHMDKNELIVRLLQSESRELKARKERELQATIIEQERTAQVELRIQLAQLEKQEKEEDKL